MICNEKSTKMLRNIAVKLLFGKTISPAQCNDELVDKIRHHIQEKKEQSINQHKMKHKSKKKIKMYIK